jgi:RNA polymerase sigma-70 factor (ECF subfamily)
MTALRELSSRPLLMKTPDQAPILPSLVEARPATVPTFEAVVERYHAKVFQLIYRYTGDYEEASDLTQDTFIRAYRAWGEFRGEAQIYTWLYRIALNLCHNQRKKGDRRRRVEGPSLDVSQHDEEDARPFEVADARPQPSHRIENDELRVRLHEALLALPENYRTVIVLRDIEGLSYEQIAEVTDSTLEAIKSRLFRARTCLRDALSPYLFGNTDGAGKRRARGAARRLDSSQAS